MIDAAIFDLDGLLIDSEPLWQEAEIEVFGQVGLELDREQCKRTMGLRIDDVVDYWHRRRPWDEARHPRPEVVERIVDRMEELIRRRGVPKEGVEHALQFVEARGIPVALASSSQRRLIDAAIETLGLDDRFAAVRSADSEPRGKPYPGIYVNVARRLSISPARCVAFEDSIAGLLAAKAAAMCCVLVPEGPTKSDPRIDGADVVLPSLAELDEAVWERLESPMPTP